MNRTRPLAALAALALSAAPVLAQSDLRPPRIDEPPTAPRIMMYVLATLLVGALVFAATLKPKRTHQD